MRGQSPPPKNFMKKELKKQLDYCINLLEENNKFGLCKCSPITFVVFSDYNKLEKYKNCIILNNPNTENILGHNIFGVIIESRGKYTTDILLEDLISRLSSRFFANGKIIFINTLNLKNDKSFK